MPTPEQELAAQIMLEEEAAMQEAALAEEAAIAEQEAQAAEEERTLDIFAEQTNIAVDIDEEELVEIGRKVIDGYDIDVESRKDWTETNKWAMELAKQMYASRTRDGHPVANVKYPLISTAVIQFHARAYPNIIKGRQIVKPYVVGRDPDGKKMARAIRATTYTNYQLMELIHDWEEGMDQLLIVLPLVGSVFKKTYSDAYGKVKSPFILAESLVVNYWAKSLEEAARISHEISISPNTVRERELSNTFLEIDYDQTGDDTEKSDDTDEDADLIYIEQHRWLDLDGDDYQEPYIVTVHKSTQKVVRIVARYTQNDILYDDKNTVIKITATNYFTHYRFMPSLDGSFYGIGFGILLSPISSTINTTINQLLDAGTALNRGGGFIGKSLRLGKGGKIVVEQGKWIQVKHSGDQLKNNLVPYPLPEPNQTLFSLLGLMLDAGKELASMADVLSGQDPPTDQPATTTLALIEQGLKVFTAVYKRIHRSLRGELTKIYRLNYLYLTDEQIQNVVDNEMASRMDFENATRDVVPISDEADLTDVQRLVKAQALLELRDEYNSAEITKRYLEALGIHDTDKLIAPEDFEPSEDPKTVLEKMKLEIEAAKVKLEADRFELEKQMGEEKRLNMRADSIKKLADAEAAELGPQLDEMTARAESLTGDLQAVEKLMQIIGEIQGGQGGDNQGAMGGMEEAPGDGGGLGVPNQDAGGLPTGSVG